MKGPLSEDRLTAWRAKGFLLEKGAVPLPVVEAINAEIMRFSGPERTVSDVRSTIDVLHGPLAGKLMRLRDAPAEVFGGPVKINNLFTESPVIRLGTYAPTVIASLSQLLDERPVAVNSLNFVFGSQQGAHVDSWYMPPPRDDRLAVASIYLDPMTADNGPLFYYPGSHLIAPYRFSHGGIHAVDEEMDACRAYYEQELAARGIERELVYADPGDVVYWHCHLMHGGSPIDSFGMTRRALVTHYWGASCIESERLGDFGGERLHLLRDYYEYNYTP